MRRLVLVVVLLMLATPAYGWGKYKNATIESSCPCVAEVTLSGTNLAAKGADHQNNFYLTGDVTQGLAPDADGNWSVDVVLEPGLYTVHLLAIRHVNSQKNNGREILGSVTFDVTE